MTTINVLQIAGDEAHAWHNWKETAPVLKEQLEKESNISVQTTEDPEDLSRLDLNSFNVVLLNYTNWEGPGLTEASKAAFVTFLKEGGGLYIHHFSNGAFHHSLPKAPDSDWPEYRTICRRVWDHTGESCHDRYGEFDVFSSDISHPVTKGLERFRIEDELYHNQQGTEPITPLVQAVSKKTGKEEPLVWVYHYGKGKVVQNLLGHSKASVSSDGFGLILRNSINWLCERT